MHDEKNHTLLIDYDQVIRHFKSLTVFAVDHRKSGYNEQRANVKSGMLTWLALFLYVCH